MVNIKKITINGYKNITNTIVHLDRKNQPITLLLAPNNYGKTNMLEAIKFAVGLIGMGDQDQQKRIRKNEYTSHNLFNASDSFTFGIEFSYDGDLMEYEFEISPSKGVKSEWMMVNKEETFRRTINEEEQRGYIKVKKSTPFWLSNFLLFASVPLVGKASNKTIEELGEYTEVLRGVFSSMTGMLFDKDIMLRKFTPRLSADIERDEDIAVLYEEREDGRFERFRAIFLRLFPDILNFRFVPQYYGVAREHDVKEMPDAYRLEFDLKGKETELFYHLSSGTRNIFLLLMTLFIKQGIPLIVMEELENGIHMSLYRDVLNVLVDLCVGSKIIITTHSLAITRHFDKEFYTSLYVGEPNDSGYATFLPLKSSVESMIREKAKEYTISIGELVFDMLTNTDDTTQELKGWLGHE
jgi:predicted ATPase